MAHRYEFKYILDPAETLRAKYYVRNFLKTDPAAENGSYTVTSLYFDTPMLSDYYDKSGGFLIRKKLRARIYDTYLKDGTKEVWLEIKKKYDMSFNKKRVLISRNDWDLLLSGKYSKLLSVNRNEEDKKVIEEFILYTLEEGRKPSFFIRYKRYPYLLEGKSPVRITFDENIETSKHNNLTDPMFTLRTRSGSIMEIKFNKYLPSWFGIMIRDLNLHRSSFSKYAESINRLNTHNPLPR